MVHLQDAFITDLAKGTDELEIGFKKIPKV